MDSPKEKDCMVSRDECRRFKGMKLMDGLKKCEWTIQRTKTGRSKGMKMDGSEGVSSKIGLG